MYSFHSGPIGHLFVRVVCGIQCICKGVASIATGHLFVRVPPSV